MPLKYLLPKRFKRIGWFILIPSVILGSLYMIYDLAPDFLNLRMPAIFIEGNGDTTSFRLAGFTQNNILNEIIGVLLILGSIMVAFSKEKDEDELISKIRLESLVWATYCNYAILLLAFLLVYDGPFFSVMIFNMFTILWFFIIRFNIKIWKLRKSVGYEE